MTQGFDPNMKDGVLTYAVSFLESTGQVRAAFSTRAGGVSQGETATMNFSFSRKDEPENVRENYRRLCAAQGLPVDGLTISRQVHSTHVHEVTAEEVGRGIFGAYRNHEADGLMTDKPGVVLVKHSADCPSLYVLDTRRSAIALLHAGWRGTVERMAQVGLARMAEVYGTDPKDCLVAVSPAIGPCCFEVGEDVAERFDREFPGWGLVRGRYVDLWECNRRQFAEAGIPEDQIAVAGLCTACDTQTFYSHRRERGKTGAMAAFLMLIQ